MTNDGYVIETSTRARTIGTGLFTAKDAVIALQTMARRRKPTKAAVHANAAAAAVDFVSANDTSLRRGQEGSTKSEAATVLGGNMETRCDARLEPAGITDNQISALSSAPVCFLLPVR